MSTKLDAPPTRGSDDALSTVGHLPLDPSIRNKIPEAMQRALAIAAYFFSGAVAINASQLMAAPMSMVSQEWHEGWMSMTKETFGLLTTTLTQFWAPTTMRVSGDSSMRGQLLTTADGDLLCNFPDRLVLVANHQIYTDWLYLWWIAYTAKMHGHVHIILKESLKRIPFIGWGMQLNKFIFVKRDWQEDKPHLAFHMQRLNKNAEPMWLLLFPEGTNLACDTREKSRKWAQKNSLQDMQHTLLPRSTGFRFCLQELRTSVDWVYDCTVAYSGVPRGQYAQDIYTLQASYLEGKPLKSVDMYWRRFRVSEIPMDNQLAFESWLLARWREKDRLIEHWYRHGRFPADSGVSLGSGGEFLRGSGHIESQVRASRWRDFLQVFAPMGLLALLFFVFFSALPQEAIKAIGSGAEGFGQQFTAKGRKLLAFNGQDFSKIPVNGSALLRAMGEGIVRPVGPAKASLTDTVSTSPAVSTRNGARATGKTAGFFGSSLTKSAKKNSASKLQRSDNGKLQRPAHGALQAHLGNAKVVEQRANNKSSGCCGPGEGQRKAAASTTAAAAAAAAAATSITQTNAPGTRDRPAGTADGQPSRGGAAATPKVCRKNHADGQVSLPSKSRTQPRAREDAGRRHVPGEAAAAAATPPKLSRNGTAPHLRPDSRSPQQTAKMISPKPRTLMPAASSPVQATGGNADTVAAANRSRTSAIGRESSQLSSDRTTPARPPKLAVKGSR